jgi:ParB family chromosome partitioning protein
MNPIFQGNAIFWVDVDKIRPNPYQPRREFDGAALQSLAESIRQYGVLQPLTVTRYEITREDGGLSTGYELIAGERRLRASRIAGLAQVPVTIRTGEESDRMKLELAIIENLQREDLNPIDRAMAFERLAKEFGFTHIEIGRRVGKSRVYVTNTLRLLCLGDDMKQAVIDGRISEGHTRPLLMLGDRAEEQATLFKEILAKQLNVREAELIAREIAVERARKKETRGRSEERRVGKECRSRWSPYH